MQQPKSTKYRKAHKGRIHGKAKGGTQLNFGAYGLKAVTPGRITAREIEAGRRTITRHMKRTGKIWIRVFPDVPVSTKPAEVRMGKGKGTPEYWVARVKPGPHHVRGRRRAARGRGRGVPPRVRQVPGADQGDHAARRGSVVMDGVEIRLKTDDELTTMLLALKKEAFNLRFQQASGQLENTARMRAVRRDVARIKTITAERRRAQAGRDESDD